MRSFVCYKTCGGSGICTPWGRKVAYKEARPSRSSSKNGDENGDKKHEFRRALAKNPLFRKPKIGVFCTAKTLVLTMWHHIWVIFYVGAGTQHVHVPALARNHQKNVEKNSAPIGAEFLCTVPT